MLYYYAQFQPDEEQPDIYNVSFPDLPGCVTYGLGLEEAEANAKDALASYLEAEMQLGEEIPEASDMETAMALAAEEDKALDIPPQPGTLYLEVGVDLDHKPTMGMRFSM